MTGCIDRIAIKLDGAACAPARRPAAFEPGAACANPRRITNPAGANPRNPPALPAARGRQQVETAGIFAAASSDVGLAATRAEGCREAETGLRKGTNLPGSRAAPRALRGEPRPVTTRSEPAMPSSSRRPRASEAIHAALTVVFAAIVAIAATAAIAADAIEPCRIDAVEPSAPNPASARYEIEGQTFTPESGCAAQPVAPPGAPSALGTEVFGDPVFGDLDGDGDEDAVLWLIHQPGGSGTFYYVAVAFREGDGFRGSRAALVGDRIEPGRLEIVDHRVAAHYLDRRPDQPMAARPTVETALQFHATASGLMRE